MVYTHRWLGIVGGVLFAAWFVSGVVMMYARMPGLANEERLARAPALDLSTATVSPIEAARAVGLAADRAEALGDLTRPEAETTAQKLAAEISFARVRVGMLGDRPVYRFGAGRNETIVFADSLALISPVGRTEAEAIARRYAPGYAGTVHYDGYVTEPDQWTLQAQGQMPMHRFALDDGEDTRLYVSSPGTARIRPASRPASLSKCGPARQDVRARSGIGCAILGVDALWYVRPSATSVPTFGTVGRGDAQGSRIGLPLASDTPLNVAYRPSVGATYLPSVTFSMTRYVGLTRKQCGE